jgi:hypothetical protein
MPFTRQQIFEGGFESDSNGPVSKILPGFFLILAMIIKLREKFKARNPNGRPNSEMSSELTRPRRRTMIYLSSWKE